MDSSYLNILIDDNTEVSEKVESLLKLDIDEIPKEVFQKVDLAELTEEKVTDLIKTFKEIEKIIKKSNNDQKNEIKSNESKIEEIKEKIKAFDPSKLDQESLKNFSDLITEKTNLQNETSKIKQNCDKSEKILVILNQASSEINDRKIDIDNGKNSKEEQEIKSKLKEVKDELAENEQKSNELFKKIDVYNNEISKKFEDLKRINSKDGVLSDEDQQNQENIFTELSKMVAERDDYEAKIAFLEKLTQELEDQKVNLEAREEKNAKNLKKQEENGKHIKDRISKFEKLAEKENLTKIEMEIFKGIHGEITRSPNITSAERSKLHDKYISKVLGVEIDSSKTEVRDDVKKQKEVPKVSRIKSRVAKAKVSTLLFIKGKFDKASNKWSEFKANSVEKKISKLEEKKNKIEEKREKLENMKAGLQNLYTNNPILDQEDVSSTRRM